MLDWIGKDAVKNHHREVPFHLLRCEGELSVGEPGAVAAVEYEGAHLASAPDAEYKRRVGELREELSEGRCLFRMVGMDDYEHRLAELVG